MLQYSDSTASLRQLLRKDVTWDWTPACHEAVRIIKRQLMSPPTLTHFSLTAPTMVTCDASRVALGAVLSQTQDGTPSGFHLTGSHSSRAEVFGGGEGGSGPPVGVQTLARLPIRKAFHHSHRRPRLGAQGHETAAVG